MAFQDQSGNASLAQTQCCEQANGTRSNDDNCCSVLRHVNYSDIRVLNSADKLDQNDGDHNCLSLEVNRRK